MKDKGDKVENIKEIQIATNETILKMVDSMTSMNKRMYKIALTCVISTALILTSLFGGVIYFLNTFEVEATSSETTHYIDGNGTINAVDGNGTITTIYSSEGMEIGGGK